VKLILHINQVDGVAAQQMKVKRGKTSASSGKMNYSVQFSCSLTAPLGPRLFQKQIEKTSVLPQHHNSGTVQFTPRGHKAMIF